MSVFEAQTAQPATGSKSAKPHLFSPLQIRDISFRNRIAVSPMCQYSSDDGFASDWHLVHLGSRATGGAALVVAEATAVEARGRISPWDLGIWKDEHVATLSRIASFIKSQGAVAGIQLAHAGRKASTDQPWRGTAPLFPGQGGWQPVAPSPVPFDDGHPVPAELSRAEIQSVIRAFVAGARRALEAGFQVIELHGAHGYLMHEFLSPLANRRRDEYGGSLANRMRFALETIRAVRQVWPEHLPLFLRVSATDWVESGWTVDDSVELAKAAKPLGIDLIDCSSGAMVPHAAIPAKPGYQVPFSERIRRESGLLTSAVGLITEPEQADTIVRNGQADMVQMAREFLREPYWPIRAAKELGEKISVPVQYGRAFPEFPGR